MSYAIKSVYIHVCPRPVRVGVPCFFLLIVIHTINFINMSYVRQLFIIGVQGR